LESVWIASSPHRWNFFADGSVERGRKFRRMAGGAYIESHPMKQSGCSSNYVGHMEEKSAVPRAVNYPEAAVSIPLLEYSRFHWTSPVKT
jgi:hypothetical protein